MEASGLRRSLTKRERTMKKSKLGEKPIAKVPPADLAGVPSPAGQAGSRSLTQCNRCPEMSGRFASRPRA